MSDNDRASGKAEDFASLLAEFEGSQGRQARFVARVGDTVHGRVVMIGQESAVVEIAGGAVEGMIDLDQLRDGDGNLGVKVGDEIDARVVETMGKQGSVVLRRAMGRGPEAKAELAQAARLGLAVEGTVTAVNKGGVEVTVAGVRGFCPISQLEARHVADAGEYVGRKLQFRVTRYDVDRRGVNLVVSRRVLLEEEARDRAEKVRAKLVAGAVLPGVVASIRDFGAFVDLGGIEGMLHVSELGFSRQKRPSEVLTVGQRLDVQVLKIEKTGDAKRPERITLSLKALERDPWEDVRARLAAGTQVTGRIVRVESFGAFVELLPGVEGLLHTSELGGGKPVRHAREICKLGDRLVVTVLALDHERRRIALGLGERDDVVSQEDLAAARAAAGPARFGTLGDLLRAKKPGGAGG
ncbi:MAG: S1 RNA-binding domain-containing protein [Deltaproteobacteria bacterium]|nr:S1 RNA-binding domain-containing protein [Deltaproteobacteria bacterium]